MDEEGSTGSQEDTVKLKEESKLMEEAIEVGVQKASDTSIQSNEETVFQFVSSCEPVEPSSSIVVVAVMQGTRR